MMCFRTRNDILPILESGVPRNTCVTCLGTFRKMTKGNDSKEYWCQSYESCTWHFLWPRSIHIWNFISIVLVELEYCNLKKCDGKSVTDRTDRQTDRRRRSDPLVSPLLTAGDTKTSLRSTTQIHILLSPFQMFTFVISHPFPVFQPNPTFWWDVSNEWSQHRIRLRLKKISQKIVPERIAIM